MAFPTNFTQITTVSGRVRGGLASWDPGKDPDYPLYRSIPLRRSESLLSQGVAGPGSGFNIVTNSEGFGKGCFRIYPF